MINRSKECVIQYTHTIVWFSWAWELLIFLLNQLKQRDLPHEIGNAFMVGLGNTSAFLMVGSSGRGIWQGRGQLKHHPLLLVLGVVRHHGTQLGFLSHSFSVPTHHSVYLRGWPGTFLGKKVIKIDVTSDSPMMGNRGHDCMLFLLILEPFWTHWHVVCDHQ